MSASDTVRSDEQDLLTAWEAIVIEASGRGMRPLTGAERRREVRDLERIWRATAIRPEQGATGVEQIT